MNPSEKTVPISRLRRELSAVVREATECGEPLVITRRGKPVAILMSIELYERYTSAATRLRAVAARLDAQLAAESRGA